MNYERQIKQRCRSNARWSTFSISICRKGIDPCARLQLHQDSNTTDQDYENPDPPMKSVDVKDDSNDHYMELDDPKFAGYENPTTN